METLTAVLASQIMSNVPAALLLSGFTDNYRALIVGILPRLPIKINNAIKVASRE